MNYVSCKKNPSKYIDVSMIGNGCGVSQYPQFYNCKYKNLKCYHIHILVVFMDTRAKNY